MPTPKASTNPRKVALDKLSTKIAQFMVTQTFTDEQDVQNLLALAIHNLDEAAKIMVANDEKAAGTK